MLRNWEGGGYISISKNVLLKIGFFSHKTILNCKSVPLMQFNPPFIINFTCININFTYFRTFFKQGGLPRRRTTVLRNRYTQILNYNTLFQQQIYDNSWEKHIFPLKLCILYLRRQTYGKIVINSVDVQLVKTPLKNHAILHNSNQAKKSLRL